MDIDAYYILLLIVGVPVGTLLGYLIGSTSEKIRSLRRNKNFLTEFSKISDKHEKIFYDKFGIEGTLSYLRFANQILDIFDDSLDDIE